MVYFAAEFCSLDPKAATQHTSTYENGCVQAETDRVRVGWHWAMACGFLTPAQAN